MGYLTNLHFSPDEGAFCNLGEGLSCDIVNKSQYSEVIGIPMSILGLLYFIGVLVVGVWKYNPSTLKKALYLSIAFMGPSLYLSGVEFFVLKNICVFCEISKVLILAIIFVLVASLGRSKVSMGKIVGSIVFGVILLTITFFAQKSGVPSGFYDDFAQCIEERGMKMYGSLGCSFCAKQRGMFGDSFDKHVNEIECDPRFEGSQVERCVAKKISHTPTWIHEREDGSEIFRFDSGVQSLEKLAEVSGCELPE